MLSFAGASLLGLAAFTFSVFASVVLVGFDSVVAAVVVDVVGIFSFSSVVFLTAFLEGFYSIKFFKRKAPAL